MTMQPRVTLYGFNRVANQLRALASAHAKTLDPILREHAQSERRRLKATPYPPKLPNQRYVRTGKLANSYAVERQAVGRYSVTNNRKGSVWVIRRGFQNRRYHLGRWYTIEDVIEQRTGALTRALADALVALVNRQGE